MSFLQVGIKAEWRGLQGRVVLFLGNKHTGALTNVKTLILSPSHLRVQPAPVPDTIPPRAQVGVIFKFLNWPFSQNVEYCIFIGTCDQHLNM